MDHRESNARGVKLTFSAAGDLPSSIEQHRRTLEARTGVALSTSQTITALLRAGLRVAEDTVPATPVN